LRDVLEIVGLLSGALVAAVSPPNQCGPFWLDRVRIRPGFCAAVALITVQAALHFLGFRACLIALISKPLFHNMSDTDPPTDFSRVLRVDTVPTGFTLQLRVLADRGEKNGYVPLTLGTSSSDTVAFEKRNG